MKTVLQYILLIFIVSILLKHWGILYFKQYIFPSEISCYVKSSQIVNSYFSSTGFLYRNTFQLNNSKTCELYSVIEPFYDKEYSCLYSPLENVCEYTDSVEFINYILGFLTVVVWFMIIGCFLFFVCFLIFVWLIKDFIDDKKISNNSKYDESFDKMLSSRSKM